MRDAVQVVVFVLGSPGEQPVEVVFHLFPIEIVGGDDDFADRFTGA